METFLIKALQLMLALAILVTIHEFGHYIFARIFGVKVEKFYLFFDPWFSLYKYKPKKAANADPDKSTWRDTEYGIGWLPLGGYVKIAGMIDESMDKEQMAQPVKPWEFRAKPAYQRLLIMIAGVLFNFILAMVIYAGVVYHWGESYVLFKDATAGMAYCESAHSIGFVDGDIPLTADGEQLDYLTGDNIMKMVTAKELTVMRNDSTVTIPIPDGFALKANKEIEESKSFFMTYRMPVVVLSTENGMGASKAGLQEGDAIMSVNGIATPSFDLFSKELNSHKGTTATIAFKRNGTVENAQVEINENGKIGVALQSIDKIYPVQYKKYGLLESIPRGVVLGVEKLKSYVSQMKLVFTKEGAQSLGGFGAIGSVFPDKWDWFGFWNITAFLSVILAFMNILPIPALDGGHVLFLIVEIVSGRKLSDKFLEYAQITGMILLFALLIYANGNDIYRFLIK